MKAGRVRETLEANPYEPMVYYRPHDTFIRSRDVHQDDGMDNYLSGSSVPLL